MCSASSNKYIVSFIRCSFSVDYTIQSVTSCCRHYFWVILGNLQIILFSQYLTIKTFSPCFWDSITTRTEGKRVKISLVKPTLYYKFIVLQKSHLKNENYSNEGYTSM